MKEIFEVLNNTDGDRLLGYTIAILLIIVITTEGIAKIIRARKGKE